MTQTPIKRDYFDNIREDYLKIAGVSEGEFLKEIGFAIQQINRTPRLLECSPSSIYAAILNVAQIGLSLNPVTKYSYLIPRWNRNTQAVEASLEPSYRGLMKLLTDTQTVRSIEVQLIYEGDQIMVDLSSPEKVTKHVPYLILNNEPGIIRAVYSIATLSDGSKHCELMSIKQVNDIRDVSESYQAYLSGKVKKCIWTSSYGEMIRKTVINRHYKFLPKSDSLEKIDLAINIEDNNNGIRELVSDGSINFALSLIKTSTFDDEFKEKLEAECLTIDYQDQISPMFKLLSDNQANPIDQGENYNAGDIMKKLREIQTAALHKPKSKTRKRYSSSDKVIPFPTA